MQGYVKLHRRLLDSPAFRRERPLKVWIWCLLRANHKGRRILWNGSAKDLLPGQFLTGRFEGASECQMKPTTFWYQLSFLRRLGNLDIQSDNRNSLVTVINWVKYQSPTEKSDSVIDIRLTTSGQPVDTDKNERRKRMREESKSTPSTPMDFENIWKEYPNRQGKKEALRHFKATVRTAEDLGSLRKAMTQYLNSGNVKNGFIKNGSTWFNEWRDWIEPSETMMKGNGNGTTRGGNFQNSQAGRASFRVPDPDREAREVAASFAAMRRERSQRTGTNTE